MNATVCLWSSVCHCPLPFIAVAQNENSSWMITVPSSVRGLPGSCVVIPCSYDFPDPGKTLTQFTGMWANTTKQFIYHPVKSNIMQQYQNRTELVGDIMQKNCSLKIEPLQKSDTGPFYFRIEIANYDKFSYILKKVSIAMISKYRVLLNGPFDACILCLNNTYNTFRQERAPSVLKIH